MAKDEKLPRINLELSHELYAKLRAATVGGTDGITITGFVRQAIEEKLGSQKTDLGLTAIAHQYERLNDEGKAWLLQCANIAADSDTTRIIKPRKTKSDKA